MHWCPFSPTCALPPFASRGQPTPGNAAYGCCKRGLVQLAATLAAEAREANQQAAAGGGGHVSVHMCSPGMVATDLLLRYATNPRSGGRGWRSCRGTGGAAAAAWGGSGSGGDHEQGVHWHPRITAGQTQVSTEAMCCC